jgi:hypothetical protein
VGITLEREAPAEINSQCIQKHATTGRQVKLRLRGGMASRTVASTIALALTLGGCSSRPREFNPTLAAPVENHSAFDAAYTTCQQLLVAGKLDASGRSGSARAGAAAGATTAVAGGALASGGGYAGLAAASATIVLLPFAIVGGAWRMAKIKRAKKERAIKAAMTGCLQERGYQVASWSRAAKKPVIVATHR